MTIKLHAVDRAIWRNELEAFVPAEVFDFHTHIFAHRCFRRTVPKDLRPYPRADLDYHRRMNNVLLPSRQVRYLMMGWPALSCDLDKQNRFVLRELQKAKDNAYALMNSSPSMNPRHVQDVLGQGFVGFKPYKCFSTSADPENASIQDFLPRSQIAIADKHHLIVTLHLSRRKGISDRQNLAELSRLMRKYPNVIWNLAHCGRSFFPENLEKAVPKIRRLSHGNVYWDTSAVNDSDVFFILFSEVGPERILYGSDNLPVGVLRGRCVGFGYDWSFVTEDECRLPPLPYGQVNPSFVLYEELRAIRRAALRAGLSRKDATRIFETNAEAILRQVGS